MLKHAEHRLGTPLGEPEPVSRSIRTVKLSRRKAADCVHALKYLARKLSRGAEGMRFSIQKDGTGLYCFKGAGKDPGKIASSCAR